VTFDCNRIVPSYGLANKDFCNMASLHHLEFKILLVYYSVQISSKSDDILLKFRQNDFQDGVVRHLGFSYSDTHAINQSINQF